MSWFQRLYETHTFVASNPDILDKEKMLPVGYISQNVQIIVSLDEKGNFKDAKLDKQALIFPATESSSARTTGWNARPLADQIRYCAGDYKNYKEKDQPSNGYFSEETLSLEDRKNYDKEKKNGEEKFTYMELLTKWINSDYSHPIVEAVWNYVNKGCLVKDLIEKQILVVGYDGRLLPFDSSNVEMPVMKMMKDSNIKSQGNLLVIWEILSSDGEIHQVWKSQSLQENWACFYTSLLSEKGFCMVSGNANALLANTHPKNIRWPGDNAKIISSNNEKKGFFTYSGKFQNPLEACSIGYDVTSKAHNALKWLIDRQGFKNKDQIVLAWSLKGFRIPNPMEDFLVDDNDFAIDSEIDLDTNIGSQFSERLKKALMGYSENLDSSDAVAIIALDAATKGRISITYYREKNWADYQNRLLSWQEDLSWLIYRKINEKNKRNWILSAPTPNEIAKAVYGSKASESLIKQTMERLLPCVADGSPIPIDLVNTCVRRACLRPAYEYWEWEEILCVACALYKGYYARIPIKENRRNYSMWLDETNLSRDYLFGRLLAVAERIEFVALTVAEVRRPTNAERYMQRFSEAPFATWTLIEKAIQPYRLRLKNKKYLGFIHNMDKLLDTIISSFKADEFTSSDRLSGEFLLGYHSQRNEFRKIKDNEEESN